MNSTYRKIVFIIILSIIFIVIIFFLIFSIPRKSQRSILFGAWTQGFFDPKMHRLHPEKLIQFERLIHKNISIAHYYLGWEYLADPKLIKQFQTIRSYGWTPMLNVNPYYFSKCPVSSEPLYKAIAQGDCDAFLHQAGKNLHLIKQPFFLLFAWEMNNDQNDWSITKTGSTSRDFILAWRHIHDIFKQEKADNVIWVFCPNVPDNQISPYSQIYPGDKYVDWLGLDGYNWGTTQSWSNWVSFSDIFNSSYNYITKIAPSKPLMIAEFNTTDQGGDKAAWYTDMLTNQIPYHFPKIHAIVIFNEDRTKQEHVNWKVDVNSQSLKAFSKDIQLKIYN